MTALPSNLAMVGEDLARGTARDAQRSLQRRRLVTYAIAFALLALTASAAIANGWLLDETPAVQALPSLGSVASGDNLRTLMTDLGSERRVLSSVPAANGAICLVLTGYQMQCVTKFAKNQALVWFVWASQTGPTLLWGAVRDTVTAVDAVSADGHVTRARLENEAFYLESPGGLPMRLVAHLADGGEAVVSIAECPLDTPDCPA